EPERHRQADHADPDIDRVGDAVDHHLVGEEIAEPPQGEALEWPDLRVKRRVERREAHDDERAEQEQEEDAEIEPDHDLHDGPRAHRAMSPRLTRKILSADSTKITQETSRTKA